MSGGAHARRDAQARPGAASPEKIGEDPGFGEDLVHYRPPDLPPSPNLPQKMGRPRTVVRKWVLVHTAREDCG